MNKRCSGCNVEKDMTALEMYPWPEEDAMCDLPIQPLLTLHCEDGKLVDVCHGCFHRLAPDMWISRSCWESINPTVSYDNLPSD